MPLAALLVPGALGVPAARGRVRRRRRRAGRADRASRSRSGAGSACARWRRLHWATYLVFALATVHGLAAGTDSSQPWASASISARWAPSPSRPPSARWPLRSCGGRRLRELRRGLVGLVRRPLPRRSRRSPSTSCSWVGRRARRNRSVGSRPGSNFLCRRPGRSGLPPARSMTMVPTTDGRRRATPAVHHPERRPRRLRRVRPGG